MTPVTTRAAAALVCLLAVCATRPLVGRCPDGTPPPCSRQVAARAPASNSLEPLHPDAHFAALVRRLKRGI
jgi:hypothetical protein